MNIGEFAQLSGLTVKALRHYDERGLLVPATVDPASRYRDYDGGQLRDAVTIKALRDAGVPVDVVRRALSEPDRIDAVLTEYRAAVAAERAAQDAALAAADRTLTGLRTPFPVEERDADPVHFAAVIQTLTMGEDGPGPEWTDGRFNEAWGALHRALREHDNQPVGAFWSSFGAGSRPGAVEVSLCWSVARPLPADFTVDGLTTRVGTLPARRELVVRWEDADIDDTHLEQDGVVHPGVVALMDEMSARGLGSDVTALRQVGVTGPDGSHVGMELALTVP